MKKSMELPNPEFTELTFKNYILTRRQDQCTWYVYARHATLLDGSLPLLGAFDTYEAAVLSFAKEV